MCLFVLRCLHPYKKLLYALQLRTLRRFTGWQLSKSDRKKPNVHPVLPLRIWVWMTSLRLLLYLINHQSKSKGRNKLTRQPHHASPTYRQFLRNPLQPPFKPTRLQHLHLWLMLHPRCLVFDYHSPILFWIPSPSHRRLAARSHFRPHLRHPHLWLALHPRCLTFDYHSLLVWTPSPPHRRLAARPLFRPCPRHYLWLTLHLRCLTFQYHTHVPLWSPDPSRHHLAA